MTNQPNDMGDMLEYKVKVCKDFLSATLLLKEALEKEEMTRVNQLIKRRDGLIRIVEGMDHKIDRGRRSGSSDHKARTARLLEDLRGVLRQIISANRQCDLIAADRCENMKKDLTIIQRKKEGLHGYNCGRQQLPKFFNVRT
jgi:hypothetical protein